MVAPGSDTSASTSSSGGWLCRTGAQRADLGFRGAGGGGAKKEKLGVALASKFQVVGRRTTGGRPVNTVHQDLRRRVRASIMALGKNFASAQGRYEAGFRCPVFIDIRSADSSLKRPKASQAGRSTAKSCIAAETMAAKAAMAQGAPNYFTAVGHGLHPLRGSFCNTLTAAW